MTRRRMPYLMTVCAGFLWLSGTADAAVIDIVAASDGQAFLINGTPQNVSLLQPTNTSQNVVANQEFRSIYEFDLPLLSDPIVSATFVGSIVQNSAPPAVLSFYGYSGNGVIETSDAISTSTLLGNITLPTAVPTGSSIDIQVPLTAAFVQALGSGYLGLVTTVSGGDTVLAASLDSTVGTRPTLRLETSSVVVPPPAPGTVPEPVATLLVVTGGLLSLASRSRTRLARTTRARRRDPLAKG